MGQEKQIIHGKKHQRFFSSKYTFCVVEISPQKQKCFILNSSCGRRTCANNMKQCERWRCHRPHTNWRKFNLIGLYRRDIIKSRYRTLYFLFDLFPNTNKLHSQHGDNTNFAETLFSNQQLKDEQQTEIFGLNGRKRSKVNDCDYKLLISFSIFLYLNIYLFDRYDISV